MIERSIVRANPHEVHDKIEGFAENIEAAVRRPALGGAVTSMFGTQLWPYGAPNFYVFLHTSLLNAYSVAGG